MPVLCKFSLNKKRSKFEPKVNFKIVRKNFSNKSKEIKMRKCSSSQFLNKTNKQRNVFLIKTNNFFKVSKL